MGRAACGWGTWFACFVLAACSLGIDVAGSETLPDSNGKPREFGEGTPAHPRIVMATFFGEFLTGLRAVAADFERDTGIRVEVQGIPYLSYQMWLQARFLGDNPPDLMLLESMGDAWKYGQAGRMVCFDGIVEKPNPFESTVRPWKDAFRAPHIQQSLDVNGHLYLIPYTQYGVGFFYNKDVYGRLALRPPATWQQLIRNMEAVKAAGFTAFAVAVKPDDARSVWIATMIHECLERVRVPEVNLRLSRPDWTFNPDDRQSCLDERIDLSERVVAFEKGIIDPERAPEFAETAHIVKDMSRLWRPDFLSLAGVECDKVFPTAGSVHDLNGTWNFPFLGNLQNLMRQAAPEKVFSYGTFPFPELTPETTTMVRAGGINQNAGMRSCLLVPKQTKEAWRAEAAIRFCHYLTWQPVAEKVFALCPDVFDIPAMKDVAPKPEAVPLLPTSEHAFLPLASYSGYDAQAVGEFWPLWQAFLGGHDSQAEFLKKLSESHRQSLRRACRTYASELDHDFIRNELGHDIE